MKTKSASTFVVVLVLLSGCGGDYERPLPRGYKLVKTNPSTIVVADSSGRIIVAAKIAKIGSSADGVIFGYVENAPNSEAVGMQSVGYFVIWRDGNVQKGLTEAEFSKMAADSNLPLSAIRVVQ